MLRKLLFFVSLIVGFFVLGATKNSLIQFNLVVTYFDKQDRINEFHRCFQENVRNKYIKKIYVLYEDFQGNAPWFLLHDKIKIIKLDHYPEHKDFYDFINKNLSGELVIWANTDIYFDDTLKSLRHVDFHNGIAILTRYNIPEYQGKWKRHPNSHDAWIFKAPIRYLNGNFKINRFINENIMLDEWIKSGYRVTNPSLTVKAWHVHREDYRAHDVLCEYASMKVPFYSIPFTTLPD